MVNMYPNALVLLLPGPGVLAGDRSSQTKDAYVTT